jgi:hypothetical protein
MTARQCSTVAGVDSEAGFSRQCSTVVGVDSEAGSSR